MTLHAAALEAQLATMQGHAEAAAQEQTKAAGELEEAQARIKALNKEYSKASTDMLLLKRQLATAKEEAEVAKARVAELEERYSSAMLPKWAEVSRRRNG